MSTIATQLNWGSSYLVEDFYRRFIRRGASEKHYVNISRLATLLLVAASAYVSAQLVTISQGWEVVLEVGAGTGGVYLLRWYWWRINAWSEISAMATAPNHDARSAPLDHFRGKRARDICNDNARDNSSYDRRVDTVVTFLTSPEPGRCVAELLPESPAARCRLAAHRDANLAPEPAADTSTSVRIYWPGCWVARWYTRHCSGSGNCVSDRLMQE